MDEQRSSVQVDDAGRIVEAARPTTEDLRRAWAYQCGVADRLRLDAATLDDEQARAARVEEAWIVAVVLTLLGRLLLAFHPGRHAAILAIGLAQLAALALPELRRELRAQPASI